MKILIADKFQAAGQQRLKALGCDVIVQESIDAQDLPAAVLQQDPDVLIVRSTKVHAAVFENVTRLSLVIRAGAGYDTIDVGAASERGVFVANCPGKNSIAVAELAWALILACDRRVPDQVFDLRAGKWRKKDYSKARGLHGRTLGVIGLGPIGVAVAKRGQAFGMRVTAWSRSLTDEQAEALGVERCANAMEVARIADVISIHVAAGKETEHLVDRAFCEAMKTGAILVNTSRGSVVDQGALTSAIRSKGIRAGLDVFADEPSAGESTFESAIVLEPNVYGTHHIGASTDQAQDAIAEEAVRIVEVYRRSGKVENCVNKAASTSATNVLTIRMRNKPGVLAHVFYILGQAGINIEEMDNIIYDGAQAACSHIQLDEIPGEDLLVAIRANPHVLSASVSRL